MSRLRALCAHPETLERPSARRDEAAGHGTTFHKYVETWVKALQSGTTWHIDGAASPLVRGWVEKMMAVWTPPPGIECELAMGLLDRPEPKHIPVNEIEPHVYIPAYLSVTAEMWAAASDDQHRRWQVGLLTAGRADLVERRGALVNVDDIKTGQSYLGDPKLIRQVLAQGIAATMRADAQGFVPGIYYARLGIFDRGDGEPILRNSHEWDQCWAWVQAAARMPADPQPGAWCLSCWDKNECSAYPGRAAAKEAA
jgi:hypothetical protein